MCEMASNVLEFILIIMLTGSLVALAGMHIYEAVKKD